MPKKIVLCGTNEVNCGFLWWVVDKIIVLLLSDLSCIIVITLC